MRTAKISCLLTMTVFIVGCGAGFGFGWVFVPIPSFDGPLCMFLMSEQPLFNDEDVVFEPALVGTWVGGVDQKRTSTSIYQRADDNAYTVTHTAGNIFRVYLVQLGENLFLDQVLESAPVVGPVHLFFRVTIGDDTLNQVLTPAILAQQEAPVEEPQPPGAQISPQGGGGGSGAIIAVVVLLAGGGAAAAFLLKPSGEGNGFTDPGPGNGSGFGSIRILIPGN